jgi:uncharacterized protein YbjT (DUF2867 family)
LHVNASRWVPAPACTPGTDEDVGYSLARVRVIVAGGHGQVALRLQRLLTADGHTVDGIVRNPDHVGDVRATGADAVVCDLETTALDRLAGLLEGVDAVVFAAGAGPGSGAARKDTVDHAAAVLVADAAERAGARRFVQVSSMGAGSPPPPGTDDVFAAYLRAKAAAEDDLRNRDLDWTILRPGRLTNDPGTGRVRLGPPPVGPGEVSRDDVAAVIVALVVDPHGIGQTLELVGGDTPIAEAVSQL